MLLLLRTSVLSWEFDADTQLFSMDYKVKNSKSVFNTAVDSPIEFSITAGAVNGFNVEVYAETVFDGSDYFVAHLQVGLHCLSQLSL